MPDSKDIPVVGTAGYKPADADIHRVRTFLKWLPEKTKPSAVVIIPSKDFTSVAKKFGSSDTNVAFQMGGRAYINADAFNPSDDMVKEIANHIMPAPHMNQATIGSTISKDNLVEWAIGHEVGHMNSNIDPKLQEQRDYLQNETANDDVKNYNSSQGKAYQSLNANKSEEFQPAPAPIQTQLVAPNVRTLTAPPDRVASIMSQKPQSTYVQSVMASSPNKGK